MVKIGGSAAFDFCRCPVSSQPVEPKPSGDECARHADSPQPHLIVDFWNFLKHNKKWWLLPIVIVILLFGALVVLSGTGLAPFIYPTV
jgi:hypothetical protein